VTDRRRDRAKHIEDLVPIEPGTLGYQALQYAARLESRGYSPHTVRTARVHLRLFLVWCDERGLHEPEAIDLAVLERYQRNLYHHRTEAGTRLSFRSQHDRLGGVRRFFRFLRRTGVIPTNPADLLELPRVERRLPEGVLTAEEAEAILAQPDLGHREGLRDRAMLELLYATGIRRQELIDLAVFDLDVSARTLTVRQGKGKKDRRVPVSERAVAWVAKYLEEARPHLAPVADDGTLFLTSHRKGFSPAGVTHLVRRYIEAAGVTKPGSCHVFRHTLATLMLDGGADLRHVQEMLGHADISTTQIYTRVALARLREAYEKSHPGVRLHRPGSEAHDEEGGAPETSDEL
jgi:integrase/recombinase XerD